MTAPQQPMLPVTGDTEVRVDPTTGATAVVLRLACGPVSFELLLTPEGAPAFGQGIAQSLAGSAAKAQAMAAPRIMVPPPGLVIPPLNGRRLQS